MKKVISILIVLIIGFNFIGCDTEETSDQKDAKQQKQLTKEAQAQLGLPAVKNFREKRILKAILELRDQENLIMYTYLFAEQTGQLVYVGKSMGYPIPYATQYTNPQRPAEERETHEQGNITLPQADPNGLYSPSAAEGSWVMMIDPVKGDPRVVYFEPRVVVSPFPLK